MARDAAAKPSPFALYRGLPRAAWVIFAATVINGAGIFVYPFLALFLTIKLGWPERKAGDFIFLTTIAYLPGALLGGKLADALGRKRVMLAFQLLSSAMFVPCGFLMFRDGARDLIPWFILASILLDGFADPARGAMNTDISSPENRQAVFSLGYLGHNLGFALGPLVGGFLFKSAPQWLFWGNALAATAAMALVMALIPESKPSAERLRESLSSDSTEKAVEGGLIKALASRPLLLAFVGVNALMGFVYAQHRFSLPIQLSGLFGEGRGSALYGSLMTANAVMVVLATAPLIALLKRWRPITCTAIAAAFYAVGFGMCALIRSPWLFFLSTLLWTAGEIVEATNAGVYISNHTPMSHRGRFAAVLPLIGGLGWSLSTPVGGRIMEGGGTSLLWTVMAGIATLAGILFLLLRRIEANRTAPPR